MVGVPSASLDPPSSSRHTAAFLKRNETLCIRRHIVGLITLALLIAAVTMWLVPSLEGFAAFCWRLGAIFGAWWLAYPDLNRLPGWLLAIVPVLIVVLVKWPRYFLFLVPVLIVLAILKPRLGGVKRRG